MRKGGARDTDWLQMVGENGWLALSCNKRMLFVPEEAEAIRKWNVGIVFVTTGEEHPHRLLATLLRRWSDLEALDQGEPRPFVRFLPPRGPLLTTYRHYHWP